MIEQYRFGSLTLDGEAHSSDVIIHGGKGFLQFFSSLLLFILRFFKLLVLKTLFSLLLFVNGVVDVLLACLRFFAATFWLGAQFVC